MINKLSSEESSWKSQYCQCCGCSVQATFVNVLRNDFSNQKWLETGSAHFLKKERIISLNNYYNRKLLLHIYHLIRATKTCFLSLPFLPVTLMQGAVNSVMPFVFQVL